MGLKLALVAAGLALASTGVNAAVVNLTGDAVSFSFDDSFLNQVNSKYTGYSFEDNTLSFEPNDFYSDSESLAAAFGLIPNIKVTANAGYVINKLSLHEDGYYYESGNAKVSAFAGFTVNSILNPISATGLGQKETLREWNIDSDVSFLNPIQEANVKVLNLLTAAKLTNGTFFDFAYIDKNSVKITAQTSSVIAPVPVPGAVWMFGSSIAGFLVSRRSKQA